MEVFHMKIRMRRAFAFLFEKRGSGYAKGGTFLMKEFHQKTVLFVQLLILPACGVPAADVAFGLILR